MCKNFTDETFDKYPDGTGERTFRRGELRFVYTSGVNKGGYLPPPPQNPGGNYPP